MLDVLIFCPFKASIKEAKIGEGNREEKPADTAHNDGLTDVAEESDDETLKEQSAATAVVCTPPIVQKQSSAESLHFTQGRRMLTARPSVCMEHAAHACLL